MKITTLEESADFVTLETKKLFSKLKSHELSKKGHLNHDASLSSKALITSARVGGHDEQYECILDDEITLLVRKFHALHKFHKERKRSPRGCFKCSDTTHFITDCPKRKKLDSSNKYNNTNNNWNDSNDKGNNKKKYHFEDKKKKKFQKIMSRACAALSDFNFSSDNSSSSEEDEKVKRKQGDFTGLCLMGKSSRNISDSDVSDDLSPESLSVRVVKLENNLCNQDKFLCKVFHENKKLNLELESVFF
jgi:hypothetical protein